MGRTYLRPELYVDNIFDRKYALKGAFFSGASFYPKWRANSNESFFRNPFTIHVTYYVP